MQEAINQLLRYSNQRRELFPTLYTDNEGVEKLFHTNQLLAARDILVLDLERIPAETLALSDYEIERLDPQTQFLVQTYPLLPLIRALLIVTVISGDHNDTESWWDWSNKEKQEEYTWRFKRQLAVERTDKTDPLAMTVVNNRLLTGFDAPVEQVMYLDRKLVAHDPLQAIARGVDPKIPPTMITDSEFERILQAQSSKRRKHFISGQNYRLRIVKEQLEPLQFDGQWFLLRESDRLDAPKHFQNWYQASGKEWLKNCVRF
jgi:hypothetical protein